MRSTPRRVAVVPAAVSLVVALVLVPVPAAPAKAGPAPGGSRHSVGLFDPSAGTWYLRAETGATTRLYSFGGAGDVPLMGDWDGDGVDTPGLYRPEEGLLVIRNGPEPISFTYPVATGALV